MRMTVSHVLTAPMHAHSVSLTTAFYSIRFRHFLNSVTLPRRLSGRHFTQCATCENVTATRPNVLENMLLAEGFFVQHKRMAVEISAFVRNAIMIELSKLGTCAQRAFLILATVFIVCITVCVNERNNFSAKVHCECSYSTRHYVMC